MTLYEQLRSLKPGYMRRDEEDVAIDHLLSMLPEIMSALLCASHDPTGEYVGAQDVLDVLASPAVTEDTMYDRMVRR